MKNNKYKSVDRYLSKNYKNNKKRKNFFYSFCVRFFLLIIVLLLCLIYVQRDNDFSQNIHKFLTSHNINLAKYNNIYKKYFGDIIPFQNIVKGNTKLVFGENLIYKNPSIYKNGIKVSVGSGYLVPSIKSGIVVFAGTKDNYGNTVIVEQVDGVDVWYGNIKNLNVSLYDYVNKGEYIGECDNTLYMVFQKDGKFLNYKKYLK